MRRVIAGARSLTLLTLPVLIAAGALTLASVPAGATPTPDPAPITEVVTEQPAQANATDTFIVVADQGTSAEEIKARAVALGVLVESLLQGGVEGVTAQLTPSQRAALSVEPGVDYIEADRVISIEATPIRTDAGCTANTLGNIDDGSTGALPLGFNVNWFGTQYNSIIVNNNGGMTFNDGLGDFTSYFGVNLETTLRPLVLPLLTDIDTRNSSAVTYGAITVNSQLAYCINWVNVGEYPSKVASQSFQLVVINQGSGNIDLEFNYARVSTPTSTSNATFTIGYADPNNRSNSLVRLRSTDVTAPYVDGGVNALISNKFPVASAQGGRYTYAIRPTELVVTPTPPTPPTPGSANCTPTPQTPVTWGIDRIDQRTLPLNSSYSCASDGIGVRAYIVDTGISPNNDFSSRMLPGISTVTGSTSTVDCNGHGTHVSGTVGGTKYGVAKNVFLIPVRVLDCSGSGYTSGVIAGLNWIGANFTAPAVVNMSLGGGTSKSLDDAVSALVGLGVTVVVAAGNSNVDAANSSPAREVTAITVGATDNTDARASYSNYGSVLDIFAPGSAITSTWYTSPTATATISGTSMASPHVAGAAAVYLGLNRTATPTQVAMALTSAATPNVVGNPGSGSPNRLLYARSFSTAPMINSVSPVSGASTGGTTLTLTGSSFTGITGVTVGGSAAASVSVVSDTQVTFITPSGSTGSAPIVASNPGGSTTLSNAFTYTGSVCSAPVVTSLSTSMGAADGSTQLTITGQNFTGVSSVTFGGSPAIFTVVGSTTITTTAPARSVGDVNVQVTSACGTSIQVTAFAYVGQPTISSLSINGGPLAGNQTVTIYGTNFTTGSTVKFASTNANSVTYTSPTQLQVTTPVGSQGTVNVSASTPGGTATASNVYSYYSPPTVSSISPTTGSTVGGDAIRILGTNLESVTNVTFGGVTTTFYVIAQTQLIAFSPPRAAGQVNIVLTTMGGAATTTNAFTYTAASSPGSSPGGGSSSGGTSGGSTGGSATAPEEITKTQAPVASNQASAPGAFQIIDAAGQPVQLRKAELTPSGFAIAGSDWAVTGQGGLNSTNQILTPGQRITITGEGLQRLTTTGLYILSSPTWVGAGIVGYDNNFTASFTIPNLPAGRHSIQINMVRQGQLPVSIAVGFTLNGAGAAGDKTQIQTTSTAASALASAQLIYFAKNSAAISKASAVKLKKIARLASGVPVDVTGFTSTGKPSVSQTLAGKRTLAISNYLKKLNVSTIRQTHKGNSTTQAASVLVLINMASHMSVQSGSIDSFIIRYEAGKKPTSSTPVLGVNKVISINKNTLTLGSYLGFGMYRLDLAAPISLQLATKVAAELTTSTSVDFAEPNSRVNTQISTG